MSVRIQGEPCPDWTAHFDQAAAERRARVDLGLAAEPDSPINAMLDMAEHAIRTVIAHGGEAALEARLERLMPKPAAASALAPERPAKEPLTIDDELELAALLTSCAQLKRLRLTAAAHTAVARVEAHVMAQLEAAKQTRNTP